MSSSSPSPGVVALRSKWDKWVKADRHGGKEGKGGKGVANWEGFDKLSLDMRLLLGDDGEPMEIGLYGRLIELVHWLPYVQAHTRL